MLTKSEILRFIQEDKTSVKKHLARVGQKYYEGEHDIMNYRMFYFNTDGKLIEDATRSNIKISHPFFTELVDQTVQYLLSGKSRFIKADTPELQSILDDYFNDDFICELNNVVTDVVSKGFGYMYAYMNASGQLSFESADPLGVIEVKKKDTEDNHNYIIYWYTDKVAKENRFIKRIQVWDKKQTTFYIQEGDKLTLDETEPINPRPHVIYKKDGDNSIYYDSFGFIPFFRLDNNNKQWPDVKPIKGLIDDYDIMSCGLSNNLADFDYPLYVVKGFQGDNLDELQQNLKTKKMIGVDSNGGIEVHTVNIPYQARQIKMSEDEKNIYRFGMGFNSTQLGDGNITNVVIKSRYALLDLKCNKLETRLKQFLKRLVNVIISEVNRINGTNYSVSNVWFDFKREVITNAQDNAQIELIDAQKQQTYINTMLSLSGVLDDDTIIQSICETLDIDYETIKNKLPENDLQDNKRALNMLEDNNVE